MTFTFQTTHQTAESGTCNLPSDTRARSQDKRCQSTKTCYWHDEGRSTSWPGDPYVSVICGTHHCMDALSALLTLWVEIPLITGLSLPSNAEIWYVFVLCLNKLLNTNTRFAGDFLSHWGSCVLYNNAYYLLNLITSVQDVYFNERLHLKFIPLKIHIITYQPRIERWCFIPSQISKTCQISEPVSHCDAHLGFHLYSCWNVMVNWSSLLITYTGA